MSNHKKIGFILYIKEIKDEILSLISSKHEFCENYEIMFIRGWIKIYLIEDENLVLQPYWLNFGTVIQDFQSATSKDILENEVLRILKTNNCKMIFDYWEKHKGKITMSKLNLL